MEKCIRCRSEWSGPMALVLGDGPLKGQPLCETCVREICAGAKMDYPPGPRPGRPKKTGLSIQPDWCKELPLEQQTVLMMAIRGPDGMHRQHDSRHLIMRFRACVLVSPRFGRELRWGEKGDRFMSLGGAINRPVNNYEQEQFWNGAVHQFMIKLDQLPMHFVTHFMHGTEILGYKHPDQAMRARWLKVYIGLAGHFQLNHETEEQMDARMNDWGQKEWES